MIGTIYCVLGFVYLIACVMDGQDVKPLWKKWLGTKLHDLGNKYDRRQYCHKKECKTFTRMLRKTKIEQTIYDSVLVKSSYMLTEGEVARARWEEENARRYGADPRLLPRSMNLTVMIEDLKKECQRAVLRQAEQFVEITVKEDEYSGNIYVNGVMNVGKVRQCGGENIRSSLRKGYFRN